jgi:EAL domain-containing protein (putative c-di-GMP-specific phosphodiesterase class I)
MNPNCFKATYQGDEVWFILDDSYREGLPANAIVYTLAEAEALADRTEWARRIVHEAKKRGAQLALRIK